VIVAIVAWLVFGERPRREVLVAIPIMLAGVFLISGVVGTGAYGSNPVLGVQIGLVTAVSYAGYLLVIRRAAPDRRPAGPVAIATAVTAVCAFVFGSSSATSTWCRRCRRTRTCSPSACSPSPWATW
jgi:drug/metabolite transporter (DMT)-like permease